jgi:uncharacterized protein (DUF433 family)
MNLERLNRITVEEGKCGGRPCIRGQRIRVTDVLELGAGASFEEILADYPFLEREDILAAIDYAAHQADHVQHQPHPGDVQHRFPRSVLGIRDLC